MCVGMYVYVCACIILQFRSEIHMDLTRIKLKCLQLIFLYGVSRGELISLGIQELEKVSFIQLQGCGLCCPGSGQTLHPSILSLSFHMSPCISDTAAGHIIILTVPSLCISCFTVSVINHGLERTHGVTLGNLPQYKLMCSSQRLQLARSLLPCKAQYHRISGFVYGHN